MKSFLFFFVGVFCGIFFRSQILSVFPVHAADQVPKPVFTNVVLPTRVDKSSDAFKARVDVMKADRITVLDLLNETIK